MKHRDEAYTTDTYVYSYENRADVIYCWPEAQAQISRDEKLRCPSFMEDSAREADLPMFDDEDSSVSDVLVFTLGVNEGSVVFKFIVD